MTMLLCEFCCLALISVFRVFLEELFKWQKDYKRLYSHFCGLEHLKNKWKLEANNDKT